MKVYILLVPILSGVCGQKCSTTNKTPCIFPFRHKNVTHVGCTLESSSSDNLAWCSTKVDQAGNHVTGQKAYGPCEETCPRDVVCRVLRVKDSDGDFASGLFVFDEIVHNSKPVYQNKEKERDIYFNSSIFYLKVLVWRVRKIIS